MPSLLAACAVPAGPARRPPASRPAVRENCLQGGDDDDGPHDGGADHRLDHALRRGHERHEQHDRAGDDGGPVTAAEGGAGERPQRKRLGRRQNVALTLPEPCRRAQALIRRMTTGSIARRRLRVGSQRLEHGKRAHRRLLPVRCRNACRDSPARRRSQELGLPFRQPRGRAARSSRTSYARMCWRCPPAFLRRQSHQDLAVAAKVCFHGLCERNCRRTL